MAKGHCEGEGAGGEAETTSILQSEWEPKRSIATIIICCCVALSMEKKVFPLQVRGGGGGVTAPSDPHL